jgi:hypothetical protein
MPDQIFCRHVRSPFLYARTEMCRKMASDELRKEKNIARASNKFQKQEIWLDELLSPILYTKAVRIRTAFACLFEHENDGVAASAPEVLV